MEWRFELVAGPLGFAEGPVWGGEALFFTDIQASRVMRFDPGAGECTVHLTDTGGANGLALDGEGRLCACQGDHRRVVRYEMNGSVSVLADAFEGRRLNSPNDLVFDSRGCLWFTDPRYGEQRDDMELEHESVYRLTPRATQDWTIERMTFDTTRPNGLALALDERTLYVAQSEYGAGKKRELRAYSVLADRTLGGYSVLHNFYPHRGIDGMCLDREGNVVATAGWQESGPGPMIYVFTSTGRVLATHPVPADRPTNCTFGGPANDVLYVTTGTGALFAAKTDRKGAERR